MQDAIAQSVLPSILPAVEQDMYYPGPTNMAKQAANVVVDNKFVLNFANLAGGASTFNISPAQGISDIICYFKMGASANVTGFALPQAWGYSLIKECRYRVANSDEYIVTGEQMYLQSLHDSEDGTKRDQLAQLGGNALQGNACSEAEAYVYINLPFNTPRAAGKSLPLPTDLLTSPVVLTITLNPISSVFVAGATGTGAAITSLASAQLQVKSETFSNSANLLANKINMNENTLTYPLKYWPQYEQSYNLASVDGVQNINLVGFKSGMVRDILMYLTKGSDVAVNGSHAYQPIFNITLTYNGLQYYRADGSSNALWSLIEDTKAALVNSYVQATAGTWSSAVMPWVHIPFGQTCIPYDREYKLVGGKAIMNAALQLQLETPLAASDYVLHVVYLYDAALSIGRGGASYAM